MTTDQILARLAEIAVEMEECGNIWPEMVLEQREAEGLPLPTPEEMAKIEVECAANALRHKELCGEKDNLRQEYFYLTGELPLSRC